MASDPRVNVCKCVIGQLKLKPFSSQDLDFQLAVIKSGRPQPRLARLVQSGPGNRYARHFQTSAYATHTWLTGCDTLARAFCWPCMLFPSVENRLWTKRGQYDLNNFYIAAARHGKTEFHIASVLSLKEFEKTHGLCSDLPVTVTVTVPEQEDTGSLTKEKRKILKRLIICARLLGSQECGGFRVPGEENSKALHELLARYDDVMKIYLEGGDILLLGKVQNDVIKCTSSVLLSSIKEELKDVTCVGLVLNVHGDWLSTVVRYVTSSGEMGERLVGFEDMGKGFPRGFVEKHVRSTVDSLGCAGKLVSVFRDAIVARNCDTSPDSLSVKYSRGFARDLQHVLTQSVKEIPECRLFFGALDGLSTFISRPGRNVDFLRQFVIDGSPQTATTSWSIVHRQLVFVLNYRVGLLVMLNHMLPASTQHTDRDMAAALGFTIFLNDLTDCFLLIVFNEIFDTTGRLLDNLQTNHMDVQCCAKVVVKIKEELIAMKNQYVVRLDKAEKMAKESKRKYQMVVARQRFSKLHDDIFECVCKLIDTRFENIQTLNFLQLLDCSKFSNYRVALNFPYTAVVDLNVIHPLHFDTVALKSELSIAYKRDEFLECNCVREIDNCLREYGIVESLPQLARLCTLAMTLSTTSPYQERRSKKMKRVFKVAHTMQTSIDIFASMAMLSIENDVLTSCLKDETSRSTFFEEVLSESVANYFLWLWEFGC